MSLSSDLISQFVKITNDAEETKKETTTYGTIVKDSTSTSVKLDGADTITPVVTTVNANDGDRVVVMIKNHTAYVTGNMSSPAARSGDIQDYSGTITELGLAIADKVDTIILEAERARIDYLFAENVTIKDRLTASEATIGELEADKLVVHEQLTANKADIEELKATTADIEVIRSDVANIDSLIFGSAGGNVIQTTFSNAVIAQLGDAQIKSAMIDSVSAAKITSGDIITNNVKVKSEDGSLVISDETMQISDDTRVRVQIGKDASNDYSINIWDASGNLMFSKGGITDNAIKTAIIRNDMVSDTANIAAHKLDIDSLFEEINDSTKTIKSTKVYLDDKKQTLDVAFKTLSSTVDSQGETITSQGTAISTIQGQISSKIWQQDIDTAKSEMSTKYSTLEQNLSGFKTSVGEMHTTLGIRMSTVEQTANSLMVSIADHDIDILNASKTATNHLKFSTSGLVIGDHTASSLGKNVLIDSEAVKVRTGETINAVFGADIIELAKNNGSATISMLNGAFKIYYSSDTSEKGLGIYGKASDGTYRLAFQPINENGNLTLGWGNYNANFGNTNIYGHDIQFRASSAAASDFLRPYYRKGDSFTTRYFGSGFVTSSSKEVYFVVPLSKPIMGSPSITASGGFRLRQDNNYTHGSASNTYVNASECYAVIDESGNYIRVRATFTATTNAVNNSTIGIDWTGTVSFS